MKWKVRYWEIDDGRWWIIFHFTILYALPSSHHHLPSLNKNRWKWDGNIKMVKKIRKYKKWFFIHSTSERWWDEMRWLMVVDSEMMKNIMIKFSVSSSTISFFTIPSHLLPSHPISSTISHFKFLVLSTSHRWKFKWNYLKFNNY